MMKSGRTYIIEKLCHGFAWTNLSGTYLNSPAVWRECGIIVAQDEDEALRRAAYNVGSSEVRVTEDHPFGGLA